MFSYHLRLALNSLRRNPVLTALMIGAVALGIGVCMTTTTVYYLMSGDPIPQKSDVLYAVQVDSWDPDEPWSDDRPEQAPWLLTYRDATGIRQSDIPTRQAIMMRSVFTVEPENRDVAPFLVSARMTGGDFFEMFDVPFLYGSGWDGAADSRADRVVVLGKETNEEVFGGENSVGRDIRLDDGVYRVVGVLDEWAPTPKFYDVNNGSFNDPEDVYMPFSLVAPLEAHILGNTSCWKDEPRDTYQDFLNGECVWLQYWVELNSTDQVELYQSFLDGYASEQKKLGRFPRPLNNRVTPVMEWMEIREVVQDDYRVLLGLAFMFLAVCLLNAIGLLLAKFVGKAPTVGLRRALGASKAMIFRQHLVEVGIIGVLGGIVGLGLAWLGLIGVKGLYTNYDRLVHLDGFLIALAIGISLVATLIAGLYPTWRVCQVAPATQLKTQ